MKPITLLAILGLGGGAVALWVYLPKRIIILFGIAAGFVLLMLLAARNGSGGYEE
jgi:hypothetical protein